MSCCHYDEGYEEGYEEGLEAGKADMQPAQSTYEAFLYFAWRLNSELRYEEADCVRALAEEVRDIPGFSEKVKAWAEARDWFLALKAAA